MSPRRQSSINNRSLSAVFAMIVALTLGCEADIDGGQGPLAASGTSGAGTGPGTGGDTATGGTAGASGNTTGGSGIGAGPGSPCTGDELSAPKRLVRLTFNQQVNAFAALLGQPYADSVAERFVIPDATHRTFPPLGNPREGSSIIESTWQTGDNIAQDAATYVLDNFSLVTGCPVPATDQCGQDFVLSIATRAHRRPLGDVDRASLLQVLNEVKAAGGTAEQAVRSGVYAVLSSPDFLYRTELGTDSTVQGELTPYERASLLSFFITDAPPDEALLAAAADGSIVTPEATAAQVTRLLATDAAKQNLSAAVFAYFTLAGLDTVVIDPLVAPEFNQGVRNAMYTESKAFLDNTLWAEPLSSVLTSRRTTINEPLANLYGVAFPMPGAAASVFLSVELPETRSGIFTQLGFLTSRARPDVGSVVARGLSVNQMFLCVENPAFPTDPEIIRQVEEAMQTQADASEREKVEFRAMNGLCAGCHSAFDAYGLGLENYDLIGKYRTVDPQNRPIDATVTLPEEAGGSTVMNAPQMAAALASSGVFARCMAKNLLTFALAEPGGPTMESCATEGVAKRFGMNGQTFGDLIREVALSSTLAIRKPGVQ
jgi:hypothetical protein